MCYLVPFENVLACTNTSVHAVCKCLYGIDLLLTVR